MVKKSKHSFIGKFLLLINYIIILCLLISYLAAYVSPEKFWLIAFFGLAYPVFFMLNVIFIFIWILRRRWTFLLSLITIIIGWNILTNFVSISLKKENYPIEGSIKVLSFNVRSFDLYNYRKDWSFNFERRNKIFEFIRQEHADIICFQEFVHDEADGGFNTLDSILKIQNSSYYYTSYPKKKRKTYFGIATFSSFPIVNKGFIQFDSTSTNTCIYTDIKINNDTIRIYNVHLQSIRMSKGPYSLAERVKRFNDIDIEQLKNEEELKENSEKIIILLKKAFIKRAIQADMVSKHIKTCPYPIVLCGDFNDTPSSYAYRQVKGNLKDAFLESGKGLGRTYVGAFPSFRIDYVMHSDNIIAHHFNKYSVKLSDHYPVSCYIELKNDSFN